MNIRKDKFLASLLAFGLVGAAACGGSEESTDTADTDMTTGGDTMAEPMGDPGMGDPGMDDPGMGDPGMEGDTGGDMGAEPEGDLGPTPE